MVDFKLHLYPGDGRLIDPRRKMGPPVVGANHIPFLAGKFSQAAPNRYGARRNQYWRALFKPRAWARVSAPFRVAETYSDPFNLSSP